MATFSSGPGQSFVFSIFVDPILADTGLSRVHLSTLYAVGTAVSAAMVVVAARMVDRFGARIMLAGISLALGAACFGMSVAAGSLALLLGFAAMRALGQGSLTVTATMLTAQWFVRRRGRAMAIVVLGLAASSAVLPPLTQSLVSEFGWREAYIILGVAVWILLIPASILIVRNRPEDLGLHPDGASVAADEPNENATGGEARSSIKVLLSPDFWLLAIPLTAVPFVVTALTFHQISILGAQGLEPSVAAAVFIPLAIASAAATAIAGFAAERLGPKIPLAASLVLLLSGLVMLQFATTPALAVVYAAMIGASAGSQGVITGMAWAHYYGRRGLGRVQGPATMVMISGAALAPLPLAALRQFSGDYALGLLAMAIIPVFCAAMLYLFDQKRAVRAAATL